MSELTRAIIAAYKQINPRDLCDARLLMGRLTLEVFARENNHKPEKLPLVGNTAFGLPVFVDDTLPYGVVTCVVETESDRAIRRAGQDGRVVNVVRPPVFTPEVVPAPAPTLKGAGRALDHEDEEEAVTPEEKAVIEAAINLRNASNEGALIALHVATDALIYACPQCNTGGHVCLGDGNPIGHTATDCGQHGEDQGRPEKPERCLNGGRAWGEPRVSTPEPKTEEPPQWVPATLLHCLAGDRIRIGADESDVTRSSSGAWHANVVSSVLPSGKTWDKITPWEHTELRLDLSANPGFRQYPPNTPCEIWMNAERRAVHVVMSGFPGSVIVDNSSVGK